MPNRYPQPPNPKPVTGSTSSGSKGGTRSNTQPPVRGTSMNPIPYGSTNATSSYHSTYHPNDRSGSRGYGSNIFGSNIHLGHVTPPTFGSTPSNITSSIY